MALQIKKETVIEMISHSFIIADTSTIKPTARLTEDLGADSLDREELAALLEENFDVVLTRGAAQNWLTVQDVIDSVQRMQYTELAGRRRQK